MPKLAPAPVQRTTPVEPSGEELDELLGAVADRTGACLFRVRVADEGSP